MPDSLFTRNFGALPPVYVGPTGQRPELIVDQHNVFLVDNDGNYLGFDENWGRGGPLARGLYAGRSGTIDQ